jgi:methylmalonyl-CoA/ethylmalonyl-CoA epimerase
MTPPPGMHFDHIGLVVESIATGRTVLTDTLGLDRWTAVTDDPGLGVSVQFGCGSDGPVIELIAPFDPASPIAGALRGNKNILNHLAYRVADLTAEGERLRAQGCHPTGEPKPALAYGGARVQFWVTPLRFLVELIELPESAGYPHRFEADPPR